MSNHGERGAVRRLKLAVRKGNERPTVSLNESDTWAYRVIASGCGGPEVKVAWCIGLHLNREEGFARPSVETIAAETGMDRRNVRRAIRNLEQAMLIDVIRKNAGRGGRSRGGNSQGFANEYWPLIATSENGVITTPFDTENSVIRTLFDDAPNPVITTPEPRHYDPRTPSLAPPQPLNNRIREPLPPSAASPEATRSVEGKQKGYPRKGGNQVVSRPPKVANDFLADHTPVIAMLRDGINRTPEQQRTLEKKLRDEYSDDVVDHAADCLRAEGVLPEKGYAEGYLWAPQDTQPVTKPKAAMPLSKAKAGARQIQVEHCRRVLFQAAAAKDPKTLDKTLAELEAHYPDDIIDEGVARLKETVAKRTLPKAEAPPTSPIKQTVDCNGATPKATTQQERERLEARVAELEALIKADPTTKAAIDATRERAACWARLRMFLN